jgi:hypothetical protein
MKVGNDMLCSTRKCSGIWCPFLENAISHLQNGHSLVRNKNHNYVRIMKCTWSAWINCIIRDCHYKSITPFFIAIYSISPLLGEIEAIWSVENVQLSEETYSCRWLLGGMYLSEKMHQVNIAIIFFGYQEFSEGLLLFFRLLFRTDNLAKTGWTWDETCRFYQCKEIVITSENPISGVRLWSTGSTSQPATTIVPLLIPQHATSNELFLFIV